MGGDSTSPKASSPSQSKALGAGVGAGDGDETMEVLQAALQSAVEARQAAENRIDVLEAELARFKDQHAFVAASKEALMQQLRDEVTRREAAEEKYEAAEEKIELLRGQVEAARRGVMQLQKQEQDRANRTSANRVSSHGADDAYGGIAVEEPTSRAAKRQSLYGRRPDPAEPVPPTPGLASSSAAAAAATSPAAAPARGGLRELRLGAGASSLASPIASSRLDVPTKGDRTSGSIKSPLLSPRSPLGSPPRAVRPPSRDSAGSGSGSEKGSPAGGSGATSLLAPPTIVPNRVVTPMTSALNSLAADVNAAAALEQARDEVSALRAQLERLAVRLTESEEARDASENCLKALREFVASENSTAADADLGGIRLPPLPTDREADEAPVQEKKAAAGWGVGGFSLWGAKGAAEAPKPAAPESVSNASSRRQSNASVAMTLSPPQSEPTLPVIEQAIELDTETASIKSSGVASVASGSSAAPTAGASLGRSLTSFFGRRGRQNSRSGAATSPQPPALVLEQSNLAVADEAAEALDGKVLPPMPHEDIPSSLQDEAVGAVDRKRFSEAAEADVTPTPTPVAPRTVTGPASANSLDVVSPTPAIVSPTTPVLGLNITSAPVESPSPGLKPLSLSPAARSPSQLSPAGPRPARSPARSASSISPLPSPTAAVIADLVAEPEEVEEADATTVDDEASELNTPVDSPAPEDRAKVAEPLDDAGESDIESPSKNPPPKPARAPARRGATRSRGSRRGSTRQNTADRV
ncbi:uncharacterized protein LOC62_03G004492 [Vanrija pseudolonga]|uniref:Uncharacterized protein n=1 Tax=Vanrija pseudolonga TaxID=143232 RepID=A0AAF0Y6Q3_9TREE|nr:hypothetical protein LOC62_03G004492 [Vanrija pseudolonga]